MRAFQIRDGALGGFELRAFAIGANRFTQFAGKLIFFGFSARLRTASGKSGDTGELEETTAWVFRHAEILSLLYRRASM